MRGIDAPLDPDEQPQPHQFRQMVEQQPPRRPQVIAVGQRRLYLQNGQMGGPTRNDVEGTALDAIFRVTRWHSSRLHPKRNPVNVTTFAYIATLLPPLYSLIAISLLPPPSIYI